MTPDQFTNRLAQIGQRFESAPLTPAMEECHAVAMEGERYMFATQTAPDGEIWQPRKLGKSQHPLLNLTGTLEQAATGGAGSVKRIGHREMVFGVKKGMFGSLAGARIHQYGGWIYPKVKKYLSFVVDGVRYFASKVFIPARPYIGMNVETKDQCREIIAQEFHEQVFQ